jgi:hypothetical protein
MTDQPVTTNPSNPPQDPAGTLQTPSAAEKTGAKTYTEQELETILKERLSRAQTAAEKRIADAAEKAALDAAAKNGEWEKLAKATAEKLAAAETQIHQKELADLKKTVAERVGLPTALATRLQGETDAEIEADAKSLLETLPKQPKPNPGPVPNPGGGTPVNPETIIRQMMDGTNTAWDRSNLTERGGGVVFNE